MSKKKILVRLFSVVALLICFVIIFLHDYTSKVNGISFEGENLITEESDLVSRIENKEEIIVYFSQEQCNYCHELNKYLNELPLLTKNNILLYNINGEKKEKLKKRFNVEYTPTLIRYSDGNEVARLDNDRVFLHDEAKIDREGKDFLYNWLEENMDTN